MKYLIIAIAVVVGLMGLSIWSSKNALAKAEKDLEIYEARISTLETRIEEAKASEDLLNSMLQARDMALQAARAKQQELSTELKSAERIITNYKPEVVTNESACLDLAPPSDLINSLRSSASRNSKNAIHSF